MIKEFLFLILILLANIVQGITGFAGTILAMPLSIFLVDLSTSKPILNVLGVFSGIYVCIVSHNKIKFKLIFRILIIMSIGMFLGFFIVDKLRDYEKIQYKILGAFILIIGFNNIFKPFSKFKLKENSLVYDVILFFAGIFHGMFVTGGPLLVLYLSNKTKDKTEFRATISFIWIVLNSIILLQNIKSGLFVEKTLILTAFSIPIIFLSMFIGNLIHKKISQEFFMKLTNILLVISGLSLFLK